MSKLESRNTLPISPVYNQSTPNKKLVKKNLVIESIDGESSLAHKSDLSFNFQPAVGIYCTVREKNNHTSILKSMFGSEIDKNVKLKFIDYLQCMNASVLFRKERHTKFRLMQKPLDLTKSNDELSRLKFHLFNWPEFLGSQDFCLELEKNLIRCGQISIELNGWSIRINALPDTSQRHKLLTQKKGFIITHVGELTKQDHSVFSIDESNDFCDMLSYFFSFVLGRWSSIAFRVGENKSNNVVYEKFGFFRQAPHQWYQGLSWFHSQSSDLIIQVLPGFYKLWTNPTWNQSLKNVIYWYLNANQAIRPEEHSIHVDSAQLFSQAALENLAWTYFVLDKKSFSENEYKKKIYPAAKKFEMLADELSISSQIPAEIQTNTNPPTTWKNSMDRITKSRNRLVHPGVQCQTDDLFDYDTWRLSMWYLDLFILHLCGHNGKYVNRLRDTTYARLEDVPWANTEL